MLTAGCLSEASPARAQSPPAATNLYNTAVVAQNNGDFQAASDFWKEFLEKYSDDPLAGSATYYAGTCKLQMSQYEDAAAAFQEVIDDYPELSLLEDAYMNLAWSKYALAEEDEDASYTDAAAAFAAVAEEYPEGSRVAQARFYEGESYYQAGDKEKSLVAYRAALEAADNGDLRARVLYALGSTEQELGQNEEALATYESLLEDFPNHELVTDAKLGQAQALLKAESWAEAEALFAEVAAVQGFNRIDFALNQQAHCAARQQNYTVAAELYARLAEDFADSPYGANAAASAGAWYYQAQDYEKAEPWLARAADQGGETGVEASHWLCKIYLNSGRAEDALAEAESALETAGEAPFAAYLELDRGDALDAIEGRREEALAAYRDFATENPDHLLAPAARYNAAFTATALEQFAEGQAEAEAFLESYVDNPLVPDVKYVQAECLRNLGQTAEAEALYADLVESYADHTEREVWQSRLALMYFTQEKYAETVAFLSPIAAEFTDPATKAEGLYLLGASQFYTEDYPAAEVSLSQVGELNATGLQADDALLLLARSLGEQGKNEAAVATATQLIENYPESNLLGQAHYRRGNLRAETGDNAGAMEDFELVLASEDDSTYKPYALRGKAIALIRDGDYATASEAFTTLLEDYPEHELVPYAHRYRAVCRERAKEWEGVIADIDAYLTAVPEASDRTEALYIKGLAQLGLEQYEPASVTFASIVPEDPTATRAADILYQLAWAHQYNGNSEEALKVFSRLASEHPEDSRAAESHYHLGQSLYAQGDFAGAIAEYTTAKEMADGAPLGEKAAYKLGWSHFESGDYESALAEFTWQIENFPQAGLASSGKFMQAECQFYLEQYEEALASYTEVSSTPPSDEPSQALLLLHAGQCAGQLEQWQDAVDWQTQLIEEHAESIWLPEARYELGWAQQNLQQYEDALKNFEQVADLGTPVAARARFMMGEIYFLQQDYAEAIRQFQRVLYGFSGVEGATVWKAKSGVEAGQCESLLAGQSEGAEREEHIEAARKFFRGVIENFPGTDEAAAASTQLERLGG